MNWVRDLYKRRAEYGAYATIFRDSSEILRKKIIMKDANFHKDRKNNITFVCATVHLRCSLIHEI